MNRSASWTMTSHPPLPSSSAVRSSDIQRLSWVDYAKGIAICLDVLPSARVFNWIQFYGLFFAAGDLTGGFTVKLFYRGPSPFRVTAFATLFFLLLGVSLYSTVQLSWGIPTVLARILGTLSIGYSLAAGGRVPIVRDCGVHSLDIYVLHTIVSAAVRIGLAQFGGIRSLPVRLTLGILVGVGVPLVLAVNARKYSYEWPFRLPLAIRS